MTKLQGYCRGIGYLAQQRNTLLLKGETDIPRWGVTINLDQSQSSLDRATKDESLSAPWKKGENIFQAVDFLVTNGIVDSLPTNLVLTQLKFSDRQGLFQHK